MEPADWAGDSFIAARIQAAAASIRKFTLMADWALNFLAASIY
jgi:hypothetical protein